jgi:hypothetical protein
MSFRLSKSKLLERKQRWITENVLEKTKTNFIAHCLSGELGQSLFQIRS